eukprot:842921-Pelagomonas_calceolata.AAC.1
MAGMSRWGAEGAQQGLQGAGSGPRPAHRLATLKSLSNGVHWMGLVWFGLVWFGLEPARE